MVVGSGPRRLSKNELEGVHKTLIEVTRKQKSSDAPVDVGMAEGVVFWDAVGQLLQSMETELSETVRDEGMTAKAQLLSRRLGVARTCVRDLTRIRLTSFTRHAVSSNLLSSTNGSSIGFQTLDWNRHDPSERVFYNGVRDLAEKYKVSTSWSSMLGSTEAEPVSVVNEVIETLEDFSAGDDKDAPATTPPPLSRQEPQWEEPDFDEEDRIREMDEFPEHAASPSESRTLEEEVEEEASELLRIRVLKDVEDPIMMADGSEVVLTEGDIENCPSLLAEILIAAGLAEVAPI
ncbi:MAG: hypothetical protein QGF32_02470 [Candidatus Thalassarchaeaceae archaeon]|nr:hypothetical protein [Candidatus Thalassarchaeaceae archaeon]